MGGSASRGSERIIRIFSEKIFSESDQRPDADSLLKIKFKIEE
jgi:hypothetical protein